MQAQQKIRLSQRPNLATNHANQFQLGGIDYTISLGAWIKPNDCTKLEKRWLAYFAALNRSGELGFIGFIGPIAALTQAEFRANDQTCSDRTTFRALKGLCRKGYLRQSQHRTNKRRQINIEGDTICEIECKYTLTEKALNLWNKPVKLQIVKDELSHIDTQLPKVADTQNQGQTHIDPQLPIWQGNDLSSVLEHSSECSLKQPHASAARNELSKNEKSQEEKIGKRSKIRSIVARSNCKKNAAPKPQRSLNQNLILQAVRLALAAEKIDRKTAKAALKLAENEIDKPNNRKTCIEWDYFSKIFPSYDRETVRITETQRRIVPMLIETLKGGKKSICGAEVIAAGLEQAKKGPSIAEVIAAEMEKAKSRVMEYVKIGSMSLESAIELLNVQKTLLWQKANQGTL